MKRIAYLGLVLLCFGFLVHSCGKDDTPDTPDPGSNPDPVTAIELDKTSLQMYPFAFYKESLAVTTDIGSAAVTWTSSNTAVATVNSSGEVTPLSIGTATITATVDEAIATCSVSVLDGPVNTLTLDNTALELSTNDTASLNLTIDADVDQTSSPVWASDDEAVATVDQTGLITASGSGTATISVTVDNKTVAATITVNPNVYVVGQTNDEATLWVNGNSTKLTVPDGSTTSYANDIYVTASGSQYIVGSIYDGSKYQAAIWIDGIPKILNQVGFHHGNAHSVTVFESNYYVAGYRWSGGFNEGIIWDGINEHLVESEEINQKLYSIAANENGIYAVGYEYNSQPSIHKAKLWELNGSSTVLDENDMGAEANGMFITKNDDIYVAGRILEGGNVKARRWMVNGPTSDLDTASDTSAKDIFVDDGVVYTIGTTNENGKYATKLWVHEEEFNLSNNNSINFYASDLKVDKSDKKVYVTGSQASEGPNWAARLWIKNGESIFEQDLSNGYETSRANAVFIK
ncbi:Ig-like domain-containing protein [Muricauda sp. 2012CJ35-5]|uniref:Ig-like domain-containing protein n=1 Tax=Flagellimonas spongiicola TaxID=2942208 RepID=A0ABT0PUM0_9FLAO|nr:Ig-like domain-containing protein [Allomuricauda spongiicola]MCL6274138.1 Ig-like domain-containing protein [Allomuricauda spongiicola]